VNVEKSVALVTGANRGVGRALVGALLERGAARVYAAARDTAKLEPVVALAPERVVALRIDLTRPDQIDAAPRDAADVTLLINNAAAADFRPGLETDRSAVLEQLMTNCMGTFDMIRAFAGVIEGNGGGAIVNVMSLQSLAGTPGMDGYSASKAAAHSLTQSLRPVLAGRGIVLCGVYPGGIDTDMLAGIDAPKSAPSTVAGGILDGVEEEEHDIFPDPVSRLLAGIWWSDPKRFERLFSHQPELIAFLEGAQRDGVLSLEAKRLGATAPS
jgi:NAD(P)-dependent dehydrogenase (short-subunit alcohol dehydrogenase family)